MNIHTYTKQLLADTKTPVALYLSLRDHYQQASLLESSDYNNKQGHYSYIGLNPIASIALSNNTLTTTINSKTSQKQIAKQNQQLVQELIEFKNQFQFKQLDFPFTYAGLFGYTSYNSISYVEDIELNQNNQQFQIPEVLYHVYGIVLVFNHHTNTLNVISHSYNDADAETQLHEVLDKINHINYSEYNFDTIGEPSSTISDANYLNLVHKAKEHCQLGDVFQLVLSRRFSQKFIGDDFNVYRALKNINPSPYLFYVDFGDFRLFGSSPEAQLIVSDNKAEIHPIAGTYKRTGNDELDLINAKQLNNDPKENAEHNMLVDLARNDLSKYCKDVKVDMLKQTQLYSHVIHLVSKVTGTVKCEQHPIALLLGTFPAGTLSGSPKHRAMQLINQYELNSREYYGGCIGIISHDDKVNHAIMIRTFLSTNNTLYYQAGAGIVVSSNPESELQEIYNKTSALKKAIQQAKKINNITNAIQHEITGIR